MSFGYSPNTSGNNRTARTRPEPGRFLPGICQSAARQGGASYLRPSTDGCRNGNVRRPLPEEAVTMSKPVKTEAELIAMARAELKVHADCPDGIVISTIRDGDSWEFRAGADEATVAKPGYPECVAMLVQIGDHLSKQYDLKG